MGRPAIFKTCAACNTQRTSRAFRRGSDTCFVCKPPRGDPARAQEILAQESELKRRVAKAQQKPTCDSCASGAPVYAKGVCQRCYLRQWRGKSGPMVDEVREFIAQQQTARQFSEFLVASIPALDRCTCCRTTEDVSADTGGNFWCRLCAYYSFSCGRCPAHGSVVFFPALSANPVPPPPPAQNPQVYTGQPVPVDDVDEP